MLSTEIHEAAVEFGRALRQAPAVAAYNATRAALDANPAALALMADLRRLQQRYVEVQRLGQAPAPEVVDELRRCQGDVRANAVIMAHLRATSEAKAFLPRVATEISRTLGTDFARLIAPTSC